MKIRKSMKMETCFITKPMLAATLKSFDALDFKTNEYLVTPKIDGIRALMIDGHLVSRTFKPIRNKHIRTVLEKLLPNGSDGEIVCPGGFQQTSSSVMSEDGFPEFAYKWFDYVKDDLDKPYHQRIDDLLKAYTDIAIKVNSEKIQAFVPVTIKDLDHLTTLEQECIDQGYEGVILRTKDSPYKCGRSTMKEQYLIKIKRFEDSEAVVTGFIEEMHNGNLATKDSFGRTKRSSHQGNKVSLDTLGALTVKDLVTGMEFEIGTGFNELLRKQIWLNKKNWLGQVIKYKHFAVSGVKDKPRHPVYLGVRDKADMST
jgi:DNA ligase-1